MNSLDDPGGAPNAELPDPDPPPGGWWAASPAGRVDAAPDALSALAAAADAGRVQLAALLDATAGGGLADRPRLVLADALTGARLTRTDLPGLRRAAHCGAGACRRRPETCSHDLTGRPGLAPPGPTDGYRPRAALDREGRTRDRRCRFPGCRAGCRGPASWTTTAPMPPAAGPPRRTWPVTAPATTAEDTRSRDGATTSPPTAP